MLLLIGLGAFVFFYMVSQFQTFEILNEVGRKQSLSKGREIDRWIKGVLAIDSVQAVTDWLRWFLNVKVLIPFRNALLWVPTPALILMVVALTYWLGGRRPAIYAAIFFTIVALSG